MHFETNVEASNSIQPVNLLDSLKRSRGLVQRDTFAGGNRVFQLSPDL
jgi:hypothetical protein